VRSLWHCPTASRGDLAAERATGEGKQHVPKPEEMRATGSGGNKETFGINAEPCALKG